MPPDCAKSFGGLFTQAKFWKHCPPSNSFTVFKQKDPCPNFEYEFWWPGFFYFSFSSSTSSRWHTKTDDRIVPTKKLAKYWLAGRWKLCSQTGWYYCSRMAFGSKSEWVLLALSTSCLDAGPLAFSEPICKEKLLIQATIKLSISHYCEAPLHWFPKRKLK